MATVTANDATSESKTCEVPKHSIGGDGGRDAKRESKTYRGASGGDASADDLKVADEREVEDASDAMSGDDALAEQRFADEGELLRELVLTAAELGLRRSQSGGVYGVAERGRRISMRTFVFFFAANRPEYLARLFATQDTISRLARQLDQLPPAAYFPLDLVRP